MKSIARKEFTATNGNTLRFDLSPDGEIKIAILKGKHFQGVAQLSAEDSAAITKVHFHQFMTEE
jgi:hypothetical protein